MLLIQVQLVYMYMCMCNLCCSSDILRKFDNLIEVILPQLPTTFDSIIDQEGKSALIWILGEYGEVYTNIKYMRATCVYMLYTCSTYCTNN